VPGTHAPTQAPPMHVGVVQAIPLTQLPEASQACGVCPVHCFAPGVQTPGAPPDDAPPLAPAAPPVPPADPPDPPVPPAPPLAVAPPELAPPVSAPPVLRPPEPTVPPVAFAPADPPPLTAPPDA